MHEDTATMFGQLIHQIRCDSVGCNRIGYNCSTEECVAAGFVYLLTCFLMNRNIRHLPKPNLGSCPSKILPNPKDYSGILPQHPQCVILIFIMQCDYVVFREIKVGEK